MKNLQWRTNIKNIIKVCKYSKYSTKSAKMRRSNIKSCVILLRCFRKIFKIRIKKFNKSKFKKPNNRLE